MFISALTLMELEIGIVFETATPFNTLCLMTELVGWLTSKQKRTEASAARDRGVTVIVLETHPFKDGNRRLSWILTTANVGGRIACAPHSSFDSVIEQSMKAIKLRSDKPKARSAAGSLRGLHHLPEIQGLARHARTR